METGPGVGLRNVSAFLETFLVEWKPVSRQFHPAVPLSLETFLVEWKHVRQDDDAAVFMPLKPS